MSSSFPTSQDRPVRRTMQVSFALLVAVVVMLQPEEETVVQHQTEGGGVLRGIAVPADTTVTVNNLTADAAVYGVLGMNGTRPDERPDIVVLAPAAVAWEAALPVRGTNGYGAALATEEEGHLPRDILRTIAEFAGEDTRTVPVDVGGGAQFGPVQRGAIEDVLLPVIPRVLRAGPGRRDGEGDVGAIEHALRLAGEEDPAAELLPRAEQDEDLATRTAVAALLGWTLPGDMAGWAPVQLQYLFEMATAHGYHIADVTDAMEQFEPEEHAAVVEYARVAGAAGLVDEDAAHAVLAAAPARQAQAMDIVGTDDETEEMEVAEEDEE